jgi:hypothetical protein
VKHRKRAFEVFTLSFLDCICCGFGAVVLFYTIVSAQNGRQEIRKIEDLTGEVSLLDEQVKQGTKNLVVLRNALEETETDKVSAAARLAKIKSELQERRDQAATYENDSLARREHINQLKADIRALEEGTKRLQGGALDKAPAGERVKAFRGKGDRRYITALRMKGKRILVLLDTSASMMEEDVVKVIKLRNQPDAARRAAQKWRRSLDVVEWVTAQLPDNSQFQVYGFNTKAKPVIPDTLGKWLPSSDPRAINSVLNAARAITPGDGTSLVNALLAARVINPAPDQIILITDGLPTQGTVPPSRKFVNVRDREKLFDEAMKVVTRDLPIDVVLMPMKGDLLAAHAFWRLARRTQGAYVIPSRDWP